MDFDLVLRNAHIGGREERAVDIGLLHELGGIARLDAASVLNPHFFGGGRIRNCGEGLADKGVRVAIVENGPR